MAPFSVVVLLKKLVECTVQIFLARGTYFAILILRNVIVMTIVIVLFLEDIFITISAGGS